MHVEFILPKLLNDTIHKARIKSLVAIVKGLICHKKLQLSELGRNLHLKKDRSGIRIVDRLLGNTYYQNHSREIYSCIAKQVIGTNKTPDILIDWSVIPNSQRSTKEKEYQVLRATLAAKGRGITIYEEVHPRSSLGNRQVQKEFLENLSSILPEGCKPCIITDAGFKIPWFEAVLNLSWNFIGRIRGEVHYNDGSGFKPITNLFKSASSRAQYLGSYILAKYNPFETNFYLYTHKLRGRKKFNRNGTFAKDKESIIHAKGYREPWVLVSSLATSDNPKEIIKKYQSRMTIEESFRDTKSTMYGFSFNDNKTIKPQRYIVWLLLAALAALVAWLVGYMGEKINLHYQFQANTYRDRRVLSFVFLGCRIIKKKIKFLIEWDYLNLIFQEKIK